MFPDSSLSDQIKRRQKSFMKRRSFFTQCDEGACERFDGRPSNRFFGIVGSGEEFGHDRFLLGGEFADGVVVASV